MQKYSRWTGRERRSQSQRTDRRTNRQTDRKGREESDVGVVLFEFPVLVDDVIRDVFTVNKALSKDTHTAKNWDTHIHTHINHNSRNNNNTNTNTTTNDRDNTPTPPPTAAASTAAASTEAPRHRPIGRSRGCQTEL